MLSRPFLILAMAIFTATLGIGMVAPILPVYARSLGASGAAVGLTFSAFALTQVFISPFAGRLADRYGRKRFLILGLLSYAAAAIGWSLSNDVLTVILFRALTGVGSALVFSLALAYIGDLAPPGREGQYMGTFEIFDFLGFGAGPLLAGVLVDHAGIDATFLIMASLFVSAAGIVAVLLPRRARPPAGGATSAARRVAPWREIAANPYVQSLFGMRVSIAISFGATFSFIAVHLEENIGTTATMVGALLAAQQVAGGVTQPLAGLLADRTGRRLLIATGSLLVAAGPVTVWATDSYALILGGFVIGVGIGGSVLNVAAQALQVELGRRLGMATIMSLQSMGFGIGVLIGSIGGGFIVERRGVPEVLLVAALVGLAGTVFFLVRTAGRPPLAAPSAVEFDRAASS